MPQPELIIFLIVVLIILFIFITPILLINKNKKRNKYSKPVKDQKYDVYLINGTIDIDMTFVGSRRHTIYKRSSKSQSRTITLLQFTPLSNSDIVQEIDTRQISTIKKADLYSQTLYR